MGVITYYAEPWVRPIENNFAHLHPSQVLKLHPKLISMLGYSIHPPNSEFFLRPLRS
jgi:hypothetical protein